MAKDKEAYFQHLIIIIDKKIHSKEQVIKAFQEYDKSEEETREDYPERKIIPLNIPKDYNPIV